MKVAASREQFLINADGKRVGVLLDLNTYERLREAEDELADIAAYDAARPKVMAEVQAGHCATLADYRASRASKA
jgi:PHD/YefM family antitoxin component YafN of YafNO toxin-antitoxin module